MAEVIGISSGIVALAAFAFKTTVTLHNEVIEFKNHPKYVRDLLTETEALREVLHWLTETLHTTTDVDLTILEDLEEILRMCGVACQGFKEKLQEYVSRSNDTKVTFKGWAEVKYMGYDVDDFRQMLATYKSTINIALRKHAVTAEVIESFRIEIQTTIDDLEERLNTLDRKFESVLTRTVTESEPDVAELRSGDEERLNTEECLQTLAQISDFLEEIQRGRGSPDNADAEPVPNKTGYLNNLGVYLEGRYERTGAKADLEEAISITRQTVDLIPIDHPDQTGYLNSLGNKLKSRNQGRFEEAEQLDIQALETKKTKLGVDHPDTLTSMENLAYTWQSRGHHEKALALIEQCFLAR
ncbi:hypothetical protein BX600DRAFT_507495 [Xylariales sp. PMI_506]|nr:hypothetical protein BX600DRAFT_507495 [Xylariales sp. PMI_506]